MFLNIIIGFGIMAICLLLQGILIAATLSFYSRHRKKSLCAGFGTTLKIVSGAMILLLIGNLAQIGIWALLFELLGEFSSYPDAYYHSAVNFSTLGYGDIVMSEQFRLLGPLEALNGIVMVGVTSAVLMSVLQDIAKLKLSVSPPKERTNS